MGAGASAQFQVAMQDASVENLAAAVAEMTPETRQKISKALDAFGNVPKSTAHVDAIGNISNGNGSKDALWPLSKVQCELALLAGELPKQGLGVLLTTGAMNPMHIGHKQILIQAKQCLEQNGFGIVGAWVSPSNDAYVHGKAVKAETFALSATLRLEVARLMLLNDSFVSTGAWEACHDADFLPVAMALKQELLGFSAKHSIPPLKVFYVCGADHAKSCNLYSGLPNGIGVVIVGRAGELVGKGRPEDLVYVCEEGHAAHLSSTALRAAIGRGDIDAVCNATSTHVARFLLRPSPDEFDRFRDDYVKLGVCACPVMYCEADPAGRCDGTPPVACEVDWFSELLGFAETDRSEVQRWLRLLPGRRPESTKLESLANSKVFQVGNFQTRSLADLRREGSAASLRGKLTVTNVVGNISEMLADAENRLATFQVASQFNCLESMSASFPPEAGVAGYEKDHTQGPVCSIACGPGTVFRAHLAPMQLDEQAAVSNRAAIQEGQTAALQINNLAGISQLIGNFPSGKLFEVRNGWVLADEDQLERLNLVLGQILEHEELDEVRAALRVGVHADTQVTAVSRGKAGWMQVFDSGQIVTQVFCSACATNASATRPLWEAFATVVLEAAYEATLWSAVIAAHRHRGADGSRRVFLTCLGGGAYANSRHWITGAMSRALDLFREFALDVHIVSFEGPVESDLVEVASMKPYVYPEPKLRSQPKTKPHAIDSSEVFNRLSSSQRECLERPDICMALDEAFEGADVHCKGAVDPDLRVATFVLDAVLSPHRANILNLTEEKVQYLLMCFDKDKDGMLNKMEFCIFVKFLLARELVEYFGAESERLHAGAVEQFETVLSDLCRCFDEDEDGEIERVEFLNSEEEVIGFFDRSASFGVKQRKEAVAWFKGHGAAGSLMSFDKFKENYPRRLASRLAESAPHLDDRLLPLDPREHIALFADMLQKRCTEPFLAKRFPSHSG